MKIHLKHALCLSELMVYRDLPSVVIIQDNSVCEGTRDSEATQEGARVPGVPQGHCKAFVSYPWPCWQRFLQIAFVFCEYIMTAQTFNLGTSSPLWMECPPLLGSGKWPQVFFMISESLRAPSPPAGISLHIWAASYYLTPGPQTKPTSVAIIHKPSLMNPSHNQCPSCVRPCKKSHQALQRIFWPQPTWIHYREVAIQRLLMPSRFYSLLTSPNLNLCFKRMRKNKHTGNLFNIYF